jgi:hypothetical protein
MGTHHRPPASYAVRVPRIVALPAASFRPHLAVDALAVRLAVSAMWTCRGLKPPSLMFVPGTQNGKVISMTLENIEEEKYKTVKKIRRRGALKNDDLTLDKARLNEFCGEYYNDELKVKYSLEVDGDRLVAKHHWGENIIMTHECFDFFYGNHYWGREIEFFRDEKGEISGFTVTGSRIANVQFDKKNYPIIGTRNPVRRHFL